MRPVVGACAAPLLLLTACSASPTSTASPVSSGIVVGWLYACPAIRAEHPTAVAGTVTAYEAPASPTAPFPTVPAGAHAVVSSAISPAGGYRLSLAPGHYLLVGAYSGHTWPAATTVVTVTADVVSHRNLQWTGCY